MVLDTKKATDVEINDFFGYFWTLLESNLADGVGFEPTERCRSAVFKTAAFDHSATHPPHKLL